MKAFAVFDIDGTLIRWQLYHAVVDKLAATGALGDNAKHKLHTARMIWKRRENDDAFKDYEKALISVYESALPTLKPETFDKMVRKVIEEYKDQVYTYTRDLIAKLKAGGYTLLAISGSHHELVEEVAKYYGFDDWIGTRYTRDKHSFSGDKFLASRDKRTVLNDLIAKHNLSLEGSIAVGDSGSDISMLEMVEQPIAFNPDKILLKASRKHGWDIVVERKNVVYNLKVSHGKYVLA